MCSVKKWRISKSKAFCRLTSAVVTVLTVCLIAVTVMAGGQVKLSYQGETGSNTGTYTFIAQFDGYGKDEDIKFSFYAKDSSGNAINKHAQFGEGPYVGGGNGQDAPNKIKVKVDPDGKINVTISKDSWTRKNNQTPLTIYGKGIGGYTGLKYEKSKADNPPGPGPDDPKPNDPTATPVPTDTPVPTKAPATATPAPTKAPATATPAPTKPAATATPVPTKAESSGGDNSKIDETTAPPTTKETTTETTLAAVVISDVTNTPKPKHKATNTPSPKKDDKKDNKKDDKKEDKKDDKKVTPTSKPIAVVTAAPTETTKKTEETTTETTVQTTESTEGTAEGQVSETAAPETSEETSEETTESSYVAAAIVRQWATEDPNKSTFNPLWLILILILLIVAAYLRYRQLKNKGYKGNDIVLYFIPGTYMTVENIMNSFGKKDKKAPVVAYPETGSTKTGGYNAASAMKELSKMDDPAAVGKTTETVNSTAFKAPIKRPKPQSPAPTRPAAAAAKKPVTPISKTPAAAAAPAAAAGLLGKKNDKEQTVEAYPVTRSTTATTNYAAQMKALKQEETMDNNAPSPFKPISANKEPEKPSAPSPAPEAPKASSSSPISGLAGLFGRKKDKDKPVEAYPQTKSTTATTNYAAQMKALKQEEEKDAEAAAPSGFTGQKPEKTENPGSKFSSTNKQKTENGENPGSKFSSTNKSKFSSGGNARSAGGDTMNRPDKGYLNMNATPTAASASFRNNFRGNNQAPAPSLATQPIPPVREKKVVEEKKSPFKPLNADQASDNAPANNLTKTDEKGNPLVVNGYLQKSNTTPIRPVAREKSPSGVFSGIVRPGSKEANPPEPRKQTPVAAALTKSNEPSALKAEDLFITEEPKKINPFKPIDPSKIDSDPDSAEKA